MNRKEQYEDLLREMNALLENDAEETSNLSNAAALLHSSLGFHWTGFYLVRKDKLVLGPFQGPVACTNIARGKGVCGTSLKEKRTIIVPDVDDFPGHIACSDKSRSEIVVPLFRSDGSIHAVLDIDSDEADDFHEEDGSYLEEINRIIARKLGI